MRLKTRLNNKQISITISLKPHIERNANMTPTRVLSLFLISYSFYLMTTIHESIKNECCSFP